MGSGAVMNDGLTAERVEYEYYCTDDCGGV